MNIDLWDMHKYINPDDITYTYNKKGYTLYYKGKPVGGAGVDKYAKGCPSNVWLFQESAKLEKQAILNGRGLRTIMQAIQTIMETETTHEAM